jgi:5-methylcytosine-specific restriction protein A
MQGGVACGARATDVDHIIAHRGDDRLRLDPANLQSFCHAHHSSKTATEDGGFGRLARSMTPGGVEILPGDVRLTARKSKTRDAKTQGGGSNLTHSDGEG